MNVFDNFLIRWKIKYQQGKEILSDEAGLGTVELILIIIVLIGIVIIFKDRIRELVSNIFDTIDGSWGEVSS